jgi:hypothetical protein
MGRTESLTWNRLRGEPWLVEQKQHQQQKLPRERNGALRSAGIGAPQRCLTLPTLLETRYFTNYPTSAPVEKTARRRQQIHARFSSCRFAEIMPLTNPILEWGRGGRICNYSSSKVYEVVPSTAIISFFSKGNAPTYEADTAVWRYYFRSQEPPKWAAPQ